MIFLSIYLLIPSTTFNKLFAIFVQTKEKTNLAATTDTFHGP